VGKACARRAALEQDQATEQFWRQQANPSFRELQELRQQLTELHRENQRLREELAAEKAVARTLREQLQVQQQLGGGPGQAGHVQLRVQQPLPRRAVQKRTLAERVAELQRIRCQVEQQLNEVEGRQATPLAKLQKQMQGQRAARKSAGQGAQGPIGPP